MQKKDLAHFVWTQTSDSEGVAGSEQANGRIAFSMYTPVLIRGGYSRITKFTSYLMMLRALSCA